MLGVSCIMQLTVLWCIEGPALEVVEEIKKSGGDAVAVKADCKLLDSYCSNSTLNGRDFQTFMVTLWPVYRLKYRRDQQYVQ